jgi:hypothetical protein
MPIDGPAWMFGDNQSVITSSTIPHSVLSKRHNALSYHRVREAVAALSGKQNSADHLSNFCPHHVCWPIIRALLFDKEKCYSRGVTVDSMTSVVTVEKINSDSDDNVKVTLGISSTYRLDMEVRTVSVQ